MAEVAYGSLSFAEQIRFFRNKRGVLTESYLDVFGAEHDVAFMVAGANRDALLADFRTAVDAAIADGETLADFRRRFDDIVARHGWDYTGGRNWRTRVIYETNLRQSYNAGRWEQLQRVKRARPYWRYRHSDAVRFPRPHHQAWDGLILDADDPWWETHFPANGWGCQCYVEALSERDLSRLGRSGPDEAPPVEYQTVTIGQRSPDGPRLVETPIGIDPGFGYAPGRSLQVPPRGGPPTPPSLVRVLERSAQHALTTSARLPLPAAAISAEQILGLPRAVASLDAGYAEWQSAIVAAGRPRNRAYLVGAIAPGIARALVGRGVELRTAAIVARDAEVLHALRETKAVLPGPARALSADELLRLPALLRTPRAVLLDPVRGDVLYVADASARRQTGKIVVALNYRLKTDEGRDVVNSFRSASLLDLVDVRAAVNDGRLIVIEGAL